MIRFFSTAPAAVGQELELNPADSHHLCRVLRAKLGDPVQIIAVGQSFSAEVTALGETARVRLLAQTGTDFEAPTELWLLQGVAKGERMELVIQKAVELGVAVIVPVDCARSVVRLSGAKAEDRVRRWQKIAENAARQCGRCLIPRVLPVMPLAQALAALPADARLLMPWEEAEEPTLRQVCGACPARAAVLIGPEGGFERSEVELAVSRGAVTLTLGRRILRTETAAIVTVALLMYEWGGLGA